MHIGVAKMSDFFPCMKNSPLYTVDLELLTAELRTESKHISTLQALANCFHTYALTRDCLAFFGAAFTSVLLFDGLSYFLSLASSAKHSFSFVVVVVFFMFSDSTKDFTLHSSNSLVHKYYKLFSENFHL